MNILFIEAKMNTLLTIQFYESMTNILTRETKWFSLYDSRRDKCEKKNKKIGWISFLEITFTFIFIILTRYRTIESMSRMEKNSRCDEG